MGLGTAYHSGKGREIGSTAITSRRWDGPGRLLTARPSTVSESPRICSTPGTVNFAKAPSQLELNDLDGTLIGAFLEDLEKRRRYGARSRNLRLTAIRSFFRYASLEAPAEGRVIQRVLAIPNQRQPRALVGFLTRPEIEALLAAPNRTTWLGRRDHAFLLTAVQTGLRLSERTSLRREDVSLGAGAHVHCRSKGRKERCTALTCRWGSALALAPHIAGAEELRFPAKEARISTCPQTRRRQLTRRDEVTRTPEGQHDHALRGGSPGNVSPHPSTRTRSSSPRPPG